MTGPAYIFLAAALLGWAFVVVLSLGDVNLAERLRAANRRNVDLTRNHERREAFLLSELDSAVADFIRVCADNSDMRRRLDVLESRGLPDLAEMRAGGAG